MAYKICAMLSVYHLIDIGFNTDYCSRMKSENFLISIVLSLTSSNHINNMKYDQGLVEKLKEVGLTKSEAEFYLTSLSLGPATAIQLGEKLGHTRQMVYNLLPALTNKGLIKHIETDGRKLYEATNPEVLVDLATSITKSIKDVLPSLKTRRAELDSLPKITIYENPLSMREWYRRYMGEAKAGDDLIIWASGKKQDWHEIDREFYDNYLKFSEKKGVNSYIVLPDNAEAREYQKTLGRKFTHIKFIRDAWETMGEKWVWQDQICYLTIKDNATNLIVIESNVLAEIERFDFAQIWQKK